MGRFAVVVEGPDQVVTARHSPPPSRDGSTLSPDDGDYSIEFARMPGMVASPADGSIWIQTRSAGLYRSRAGGEGGWQHVPVRLPDAPPEPHLLGLGVTRAGRLLLLHQARDPTDPPNMIQDRAHISHSDDNAATWTTAEISFAAATPPAALAARGAYRLSANDVSTFWEDGDGVVHVSLHMRWRPHAEEAADPANLDPHSGLIRPERDLGAEIVLRSGSTDCIDWADPTVLAPSTYECCTVADPQDPSRLLTIGRVQRPLLAGEDEAPARRATGCPATTQAADQSFYKNGAVLSSRDGGRTFQQDALLGYYEYRGTALWTQSGTVVLTTQGRADANGDGGASIGGVFARVSVDGARSWLGEQGSTTDVASAKTFEIVGEDPGHSFTSPTVAVGSPGAQSFLTAFVTTVRTGTDLSHPTALAQDGPVSAELRVRRWRLVNSKAAAL